MEKPPSKPKRRLKKVYRDNKLASCQAKVRLLQRRIKELEDKLSGGWVSPDGTYCDTKYAAVYLGKSEGTLRNMRNQGTGPKAYTKSGSVYYMLDDLHAWIREGRGARHES